MQRLQLEIPFQVEADTCYPVYDDEMNLIGSLLLKFDETFVGFVTGFHLLSSDLFVTPFALVNGVVRSGFVFSDVKMSELSYRVNKDTLSVTPEEVSEEPPWRTGHDQEE
jgi:hypothetical protein